MLVGGHSTTTLYKQTHPTPYQPSKSIIASPHKHTILSKHPTLHITAAPVTRCDRHLLNALTSGHPKREEVGTTSCPGVLLRWDAPAPFAERQIGICLEFIVNHFMFIYLYTNNSTLQCTSSYSVALVNSHHQGRGGRLLAAPDGRPPEAVVVRGDHGFGWRVLLPRLSPTLHRDKRVVVCVDRLATGLWYVHIPLFPPPRLSWLTYM